MTLPRIECWYFSSIRGGYAEPATTPPFVAGEVYGHPRRPAGNAIRTSVVVGFRDGVVTTESGSRYQLGKPDPHYVAWMARLHPWWDPQRPLEPQAQRAREQVEAALDEMGIADARHRTFMRAHLSVPGLVRAIIHIAGPWSEREGQRCARCKRVLVRGGCTDRIEGEPPPRFVAVGTEVLTVIGSGFTVFALDPNRDKSDEAPCGVGAS